MVAFANLIPEDAFGTYSYIMAVVSIVTLTSLPGIDSSLVPAIARGFDSSIFNAQRVRLRWSIIGSVILLLISGYYFYQTNFVLATGFLVTGLIFPLFISFNQYSLYLSGKKFFREQAVLTVAVKFLFATTLSIALLFTNNVALLVGLNMGVIAITGIIFTRHIIARHREKLNTPSDNNIVSYGKHLTVMNAFETISKYLDKILLWHFFGPIQVAVWAFANTPIQIAQGMVSKTVGTIAVPKFAQNDFNQTKKQLPAKVAKLFLVLLPIAILYVITVPILFRYLLPQYIDSIIYTQALAILLILIPFNFFAYFLQAQTKKKSLYVIKIGSGTVSLIALAILIPIFGLWGAVLAHIVAATFRSLLSLVLFVRAH